MRPGTSKATSTCVTSMMPEPRIAVAPLVAVILAPCRERGRAPGRGEERDDDHASRRPFAGGGRDHRTGPFKFHACNRPPRYRGRFANVRGRKAPESQSRELRTGAGVSRPRRRRHWPAVVAKVFRRPRPPSSSWRDLRARHRAASRARRPRVTVLERDTGPVPESPHAAWEAWERKGVAQFRQPHNFMPGLRLILEAELPDVQEAFRRAGASRFDLVHPLPPTRDSSAAPSRSASVRRSRCSARSAYSRCRATTARGRRR